MGKRGEIEFEPILQPGGRIALTVYPPGSWFDNKTFKIFVGGCGRGERRTLDSAKSLLLELAVAECDEYIARGKAAVEHYERERQKLNARGLRVEKPNRATKRRGS